MSQKVKITVLVLILALFSLPALAQTRISEATDAGTLAGTEMLPLAKPANTGAFKTTVNDIKTFLFGSTGQTGLDNAFKTPVQGSVAPIVAQCAGGGDEATLLSATNAATTKKTGVLVSHGCQINNRLQLEYNTFQSLSSFTGANTDATSIEPYGPRITVNTDNINTNSPSKTAIDMNGVTTLSLNGVNIKGTNQATYASLIANSNQNVNCCAKNALELNNSSLMNAQALVGPAMDMGTRLPATGTVGNSPNYLPRALKSQFSNFETGFTGNFSDLMLWNSQISGGGWAALQTYGGGGQQILGNRIEFIRGGVWYTGTGSPGGSYFNSNSLSVYDDAAAIFEIGTGFTANDNIVNGPQAGNTNWNGNFTNDRHWVKGAGWAITGGVAQATAASSDLSQKAHILNGATYTINYTVVVTSGSVTPNVGGTAGTTRTTSGTYSESIVASSTAGIVFTGASFTGSVDSVTTIPTMTSAFVIGGAGNAVTNVVVADNVANTSSSKLKYGVDLQGGGSDYIMVSGVYSAPSLVGAVNYGIEQPTHMVEDTLGAGASGWTGQHAERGRPFGIGTLTPRNTVALDLNGTDNVSKPLGLPSGTTAQRPTCNSTVVGGFRYNSTTSTVEVCNGSSWVSYSSGSGDVTGGASSTDNAVARYDSTTGKVIQNSGVIIDDSNNVSGIGTLANGTQTVTSTSASALAVGGTGATNPAFAVDASTASSATGIVVKSAVSGGGVTITATGGTHEDIKIVSKGGSGKAILDAVGYSVLSTNGTPRLTVDGYSGYISSTWRFVFDKTVTTAGTTGAQTINKPSGCVNFAAAASSLTVTNNMVTADSVVSVSVNSNDATLKSASAVVSSGSFVLNGNTAATAETKVCFVVFN